MLDFDKLLEAAESESVEDEDGDEHIIERNEGAAEQDLQQLEVRHKVVTPESLKALLRASNGGLIWSIELVGTHEDPARVPDRGWIPINNWGNGDFDWVVCGADPDYPVGSVVFYCHESGKHALIDNSIDAWLENTMNEIRANGGLAHPQDYVHYDDFNGVYKSVYLKIKS